MYRIRWLLCILINDTHCWLLVIAREHNDVSTMMSLARPRIDNNIIGRQWWWSRYLQPVDCLHSLVLEMWVYPLPYQSHNPNHRGSIINSIGSRHTKGLNSWSPVDSTIHLFARLLELLKIAPMETQLHTVWPFYPSVGSDNGCRYMPESWPPCFMAILNTQDSGRPSTRKQGIVFSLFFFSSTDNQSLERCLVNSIIVVDDHHHHYHQQQPLR